MDIAVKVRDIFPNTVECSYNAVQYNTTMQTPLHQSSQNINQDLHSRKTP